MVKVPTENGVIQISGSVFATLVGEAATSCFGVKGMAARSVTDGLVHLLKKESMGKGVTITFNDDATVSIGLHIIVEQGVNITAICRSIIHGVRYKVESAAGVPIRSVDVYVDSINMK